MIDPQVGADLAPDARVSVTTACLNEVVGLLYELPARQSMALILRVQQEAEVVGPCGEAQGAEHETGDE